MLTRPLSELSMNRNCHDSPAPLGFKLHASLNISCSQNVQKARAFQDYSENSVFSNQKKNDGLNSTLVCPKAVKAKPALPKKEEKASRNSVLMLKFLELRTKNNVTIQDSFSIEAELQKNFDKLLKAHQSMVTEKKIRKAKKCL